MECMCNVYEKTLKGNTNWTVWQTSFFFCRLFLHLKLILLGLISSPSWCNAYVISKYKIHGYCMYVLYMYSCSWNGQNSNSRSFGTLCYYFNRYIHTDTMKSWETVTVVKLRAVLRTTRPSKYIVVKYFIPSHWRLWHVSILPYLEKLTYSKLEVDEWT